MPSRAPRICGCGKIVPAGEACVCQARRDAERKARFDKRRPNARARGYTRAWDQARAEFLEAHPTCRRCRAPATVVDHIKPHKSNAVLFWDRKNWQALCIPCHSGAKQSEERRHLKGH